MTLGRYSRDLTNGSRPRHGSPGNADACRGWRLRLRRGLCSPGLEQSGQRSPELSLDCSRLRSVARSPNDRARKSTPASRAEAASRTTMCWRNCRKPAAPTSDAMSPWRRSRPPGSGLLPLQPVENDLGGGGASNKLDSICSLANMALPRAAACVWKTAPGAAPARQCRRVPYRSSRSRCGDDS